MRPDSKQLSSRALLCRLRGDPEGALSHMRRAAAMFDKRGMNIHALSLRRKIGEWVGGESGAALIVEADRHLRELGIANPAAAARMHTTEIA